MATWIGESDMTYHLDLHQCFIAVVQKVTRLAAINSDDTQEQLATEAKSQWYLGSDNGLNTVVNVGLQDLLLGDLALYVGRQPDPGQSPVPLEEGSRIEHGDGVCSGSYGGDEVAVMILATLTVDDDA